MTRVCAAAVSEKTSNSDIEIDLFRDWVFDQVNKKIAHLPDILPCRSFRILLSFEYFLN